MECPNCSSSGLISATVYWASRSNQYIAAAVDGVLKDTIGEWERASKESKIAALKSEPVIFKKQLSAALSKK